MNNHIGTAFEIIKQVADRLEWNYSHGDITSDPKRSKIVYPLVHTTIGPLQLNKQASIFQMNVMIGDVVNFLKTENQSDSLETKYDLMGYTENQNYANVLQELYVKFSKALYQVQYDRYGEFIFSFPLSFNPFIEDGNDVIAGWTITLTFELQSPFVTDGRC